jgi:uncharacterized protein (DUF924 family)
MQAPEDVLKFWFEDHGRDDWFGGKAEFDAEIVARFGATHAGVAAGEAYTWRKTPEGRLAEIIVLDQFSRHIHRGKAQAFATDGMALILAQEAVALGIDQKLDPMKRVFLYLPYEHSESPTMQAHSLRLFQSLGIDEVTQFAKWHVEVIQRFGRFPKRNAALGRESTPEELVYIESKEHTF